MPRHLNTNVYVDETWYYAGQVPPPDVAERITNPKVWAGEDAPTSTVTAPEVKQPPRKGPGSGGPAWIEFAKSKGVEGEFASKDELIGELESRGLIEKE
jgi:hypothetical protein